MTLLQAYTMANALAMPSSATHSAGRLVSGRAVSRRGCDNMARDHNTAGRAFVLAKVQCLRAVAKVWRTAK